MMVSTTQAGARAAMIAVPVVMLTVAIVLVAMISLIPNKPLRSHVYKLMRLLTVTMETLVGAQAAAGSRG